MALPGFIFGGSTGVNSPEELARARAYAEALLGPQRPAQNVGEGLAVLGQAIRGLREMNAVNKASAAGDASASSAVMAALGGGQFPAAPTIATTAAAPSAPAQTPSPVAAALSGAPASAPSADGDTSWLAYDNQGATRNKPLAPKLVDALSFLPQMGVTMKVFSGGQDETGPHRTGSHRHDDGNAGDVFFYKDGRKLDWANPQDLPIFEQIVQEGKARGITGIGAGEGYMQPGSMHIGFGTPSVWGAGGRGDNAPSWLRSAYNGAPVGPPPTAAGRQVASIDPSAGMPAAPSPVAAALQLPQQGPIPQGRPDVAAALNGAPAPAPGAVGGPEATTPAGQRVLGQMMSPLPMGGQSMQMQPPQQAQAAPPLPSSQVSPDPMAPAAPPAQPSDNLPVMAGGSADAVQPGQGGPSVQQLMQAAQNPWLKPEQRALVNGLLAQKMKQQDPATLLEMEKNRLDMEKTRIETERLRNPQMTPAEKARLDLDTQKFQADQKKLMELSPGTTVFDPSTKQPVYSAPKENAKPAGVQEYEYAKAQGFPGTYADWEASKKGGMSLQVDPTTGEVTFQQGGNIKPMTEAQSKDTTFATRAAGALPLLDKFGDSLTSLSQSAGGQVPMVGNYLKSPEYQQAEQAGKEFLQAILRKDTGAAITAGETAEYGSVYLPRPGDSPELLAQKKASRTRALEAMKAGMTPQAILAQEKALAASPNAPGAPVAPAAPGVPGAPKAGAVEDGYRFKGGDPADQKNWEPVQ